MCRPSCRLLAISVRNKVPLKATPCEAIAVLVPQLAWCIIHYHDRFMRTQSSDSLVLSLISNPVEAELINLWINIWKNDLSVAEYANGTNRRTSGCASSHKYHFGFWSDDQWQLLPYASNVVSGSNSGECLGSGVSGGVERSTAVASILTRSRL